MTDAEKAQRRADERAELRKAAAQVFPLYLKQIHGLTEQQVNGKQQIRCLNPLHDDSNASMRYYPEDAHLYCFGCQTRYDMPALVAADNNLTVSAPETWAQIQTWAQHGGFIPRIEDIPISVPDSSVKKEYDQRQFFRRCAQNRTDQRFIDYMQKRGISIKTSERFNIGFYPRWKPAMQSPLPPTPRIIIPTSDFSYSARYCGDPPAGIEKVMKRGRLRLFNTEAANQDCTLFLCEGEFDALSIIENEGAAIALGGLSNKQRFLQAAPKLLKDRVKPLIIALDSDERGKQVAAEIITALHGMRRNGQIPSFKIRLFTAYCGCKDINEMHTTSPDRLKAVLRNVGGILPQGREE
jgi:DNA primase